MQKEATAGEMMGQRWSCGAVPEALLRTDHVPCQQSILRAGREAPLSGEPDLTISKLRDPILYVLYFLFMGGPLA